VGKKCGNYHFVVGVLPLPEPGTDTLSVGTRWHLGWDGEVLLESVDTLIIYRKYCEVLWLHLGSVILIGDGKATPKELLRVNWITGVI